MKQRLIVVTLLPWAVLVAGCGDLLAPPPPPLTPEPSTPGFPDYPDDPSDPGDGPDVTSELTLTEVAPDEGPAEGGVDVMLTGTGFADGLEVFFGEAPAPEVFVVSATTAIARLPPHPSGRVDVMVAHFDFDQPYVLPLSFRYFETLVVTAIDPAEGPLDGGVPVVVRGRGFTPDTRFFIGGRLALDQRFIDAETLTGVAPPGPFGAADVHAVGINGTAALDDAFRFRAAPRLDRLTPIAGPTAGGTRVVLEGSALSHEATVLFGDAPADVIERARDGTRLVALSPALPSEAAGAPTTLVDVSVADTWGASSLGAAFAYRDLEAPPDPLVLACTHLVPTSGDGAGGERVELACTGLVYGDIAVRFGEATADIVAVDVPGSRLEVVSPPGAGTVDVVVRSAAADWVRAGAYSYRAPPAVAITEVTPDGGPIAGGTRLRIRGRGFASGATVQVGALPATSVALEADGSLSALTPPGVPGRADVIVRSSGLEARAEGAFDYRSEHIALDLVAPATAARSGGTWLRVYGSGFSDATEVVIGGVPCPLIARVSSAELAVRSPKLEVGIYDAEVRDGERTATLPRALVTYDPRSGSGGTRGGPIDETLNVTVWGSNGYGPVADAFVLVGSDPNGPWRGITDDNGQVTISGPGLYGPVEVTASRDGFTAYSVLRFDATNVTVLLTQNPIPPQPGGGGTPPTTPPNAIVSGRVFGLDKYVVAPPASCEAKAIPETLHCAPCDPAALDGGCDGTPGLSCLEVGDQGPHCVASCATDADCQAGYACAGTALGAHCLPSAGTKRAYCNISSPSLFGYEYPLQQTGWVDDAGFFSLDSRRLGEIAIYCFGGYEDEAGQFTPTVLGVLRNLFAPPGGNISGLAIDLSHPLRRSFRLRLQDPPTWATGLLPPNIAISLDLGPDGVIPFSRQPVPVGDHTFIAPHQLMSLSGELYNARYFLYTTLAPAGVSGSQPRSYNLVQNVQSIVEDRLPVRDVAGWRLEGTQIEKDLFGIWAAPAEEGAGPRAWAVGEDGTILLWNGSGWTAQTSFTDETLRAISGVSGEDVWAVGEDGAVRHWDGLAWQAVPAPEDDYEAVYATATSVYAAGAIRLRRLDRESGTWSLEGAPAVQGVTGFVPLADGRLVALSTGRLFVSREGGWDLVPSAPVRLAAGLVRRSGELVLVGDAGTVLAGPGPEALTEIEVPTYADLTALTEDAEGALVIVGDDGVALFGQAADALRVETIPDYRSKAHGVVALGGEVRVVGSAAFILGPFLHFPIVTAPLYQADAENLAFAWTWTGGPPNQYTRLGLTPDASITVWTLIVEGDQRVAVLPDLQAAAGLARLAPGRYRLDVLRVLNRNFEIDNFTTRDFNLYARDSWTTNEAYFFVP